MLFISFISWCWVLHLLCPILHLATSTQSLFGEHLSVTHIRFEQKGNILYEILFLMLSSGLHTRTHSGTLWYTTQWMPRLGNIWKKILWISHRLKGKLFTFSLSYFMKIEHERELLQMPHILSSTKKYHFTAAWNLGKQYVLNDMHNVFIIHYQGETEM